MVWCRIVWNKQRPTAVWRARTGTPETEGQVMARYCNIVERGSVVSTIALVLAASLHLSGASAAPAAARARPPGTVGLGKVLTSKSGGQIFGFDINQSGDDGVLATAADVEVFDQNTGKIKRSFGRNLG